VIFLTEIDQAEKEYISALNELLHIRQKYKGYPNKLKEYEPSAILKVKIAETKLGKLKEKRSETQ